MMDQRQCVVLYGDYEWCRHSALTALANYDLSQSVWLSEQAPDNINGIHPNKAQSLLGQEFHAVVIDGFNALNPDTLGAVIGTVIAGGAVIIMLADGPSASLWQTRFDFICQRFAQSSTHFHLLRQSQTVEALSAPQSSNTSTMMMSEDQQQALNAILKVVHGHRRRPLVLSADRGRGKSAILGIAAAELIQQGKESILVTAPSLASAAMVFEHAKCLLPDGYYSQGQIINHSAVIKFVAPDILVESTVSADVLLVDEAAAIPAAMLEKLLDKFSRIVFASTIHGYEGTGRGFAVRFQKTLDQKTPDWNQCHMSTPNRWRDDDMLERFSFDALLLDAVPVNDELIKDATIEQCVFEQIDRQALIEDESLLRSLFGLMVLAHYRTRPSDLMMMLDRDDISVYVMRFNYQIVASAWCVDEGQLDPDIAEAIYDGQRRLKGHLLPQSLLAHAGLSEAGSLRYQRIIRIAVHPAIQGRGIGHHFVGTIVNAAKNKEIDVVGASFASSIELIHFWSQSQFQFLRLGMHHDEVSGSHSSLMLTGISEAGQNLIEQGLSRFKEHWPLLLQQQFAHLQPQLVICISQLLIQQEQDISSLDLKEISAFALKQRSFEVCQISLWQAMSNWVRQAKFLLLPERQQALCVMFILQQRSIKQTAEYLGYSGKAELISDLRQAIASLLL